MHEIVRSPTPGGLSLLIFCNFKDEDRLNRTHFRGRGLKQAGNFKLWQSLEEMFKGTLRNMLADDAWERWAEQDFGTSSSVFLMPVNVGWESTLDQKLCRPDELEEFAPNRRSTALRVRTDLEDRLAPLTREITVIYELSEQRGEPKVTIWSLYPGTDIGELNGDITKREGRVFFDWNHPGE